MTAEVEPEPGLPGVDAYAEQLDTAHRASAWPGIQPPDKLAASSSAAHDPTADLRELILSILQR